MYLALIKGSKCALFVMKEKKDTNLRIRLYDKSIIQRIEAVCKYFQISKSSLARQAIMTMLIDKENEIRNKKAL